jgi:aconitate hydratase
MVNGLGVLGWGVGGIEAEAAMLGQPMSMLIPQVVGFRLHGALPEGATATDLVLTVTEMLRQKGVVGTFVEFYGQGISSLPLADRATIGNMSPEFGSTCAIFPIDAETIRYLAFSGRPPELLELVEAYAREQGMWHDEHAEDPTFSDTLELDLSTVVPSIAGPKRPQDRVRIDEAKVEFREALTAYVQTGTTAGQGDEPRAPGVPPEGVQRGEEEDEASSLSFPASDPVATSAPARTATAGRPRAPRPLPRGRARAHVGARDARRRVVRAGPRARRHRRDHVVHEHLEPERHARRGLVARNAVARGLERKPWVKTSLAPGLEGGHGVPGARGAHRAARGARLPPGRLRLHDVHRELRAAARGDLRGDRPRPTWPRCPSCRATATSRGASTPT